MTNAPVLSPLTNRRDLAGIAVTGGRVRPGVLWRADDVSRVDPSTADALVAEGLTLILDLRSAEEAAHTGRGPLGEHPVAYRHLPFTERASIPGRSLAEALAEYFGDDAEQGMGTWYAMTAEAQAPKILEAFGAIIETPGATVFHCTAGKDRTGILAAALLLTLGADRGDVVADYARTNDNLDALLARIATGGGHVSAVTDAGVPDAVKGAPARNLSVMLDQLDANHGGFVPLLRDSGLTDAMVEDLRARAVQS